MLDAAITRSGRSDFGAGAHDPAMNETIAAVRRKGRGRGATMQSFHRLPVEPTGRQQPDLCFRLIKR